MLTEASSYGFEDEPRYSILIFLLENELLKLNCLPDNKFTFLQRIPGFFGMNTVHKMVKIDKKEDDDSVPEEFKNKRKEFHLTKLK